MVSSTGMGEKTDLPVGMPSERIGKRKDMLRK